MIHRRQTQCFSFSLCPSYGRHHHNDLKRQYNVRRFLCVSDTRDSNESGEWRRFYFVSLFMFFFGKSHAVIRARVSINKISHDLYAFELIWWCLLSIYTTPAQFRFIGVFEEIDFEFEKPKTHENSKNKYLSINMNYDFSLLSFHYFVSLSSRFSSC